MTDGFSTTGKLTFFTMPDQFGRPGEDGLLRLRTPLFPNILFQAICPPEAVFLVTAILRPKAGQVSFPKLDVPDDCLLGPTDSGVHIPFFGDLSDFLNLHICTPLFCSGPRHLANTAS